MVSYSQKYILIHFRLTRHLTMLDARKYRHSTRLVMVILMICVSNFYDHWMVSYLELDKKNDEKRKKKDLVGQENNIKITHHTVIVEILNTYHNKSHDENRRMVIFVWE